MKLARVRPVEPNNSSDVFHVERRGGAIEHVPGTIVIRRSRFFLVMILAIVLIGTGFYAVATTHAGATNAAFDVKATAGKTELTGAQLRALVIKEGITAYWVGPEPGASYALSVLTDGQVYVKYLPDGKGLDDTKPAYKVIATYVTAGAFAKTQQAATASGSVGFINSDGNAIYYATARPTNVYMGMRDVDLQVEVFDPVSGNALKAAKTSGLVRKIV